jgi:hypothetical protein
MSTITLSPSLAAFIDEAGALDSEIKRLTKQLDVMKSRIKEHGAGDFGGFAFNAKVIESAPVERVDWKTIAERLNPSYQLIAAHTTVAAPVTSIRFTKA